ncbi:MAG: winged helix-turn-helix domain-containing protein [Aliidongia sp.]
MSRDGGFERGYSFDAYRLFPDLRCLCRGNKIVHLNPTAMRVLIALVEHLDQVVTKDELMKLVWFGSVIDENNLATHIGTLRKLLGRHAIKTIHGNGYQFAAAVTLLSAESTAPTLPVPDLVGAAPKTNLAQRLVPMIGREDDLAGLEDCLDRHCLVTLVGAGGTGKTRLALSLGWKLLPRFADGVWLIDLAPVTKAEMIATVTAAVLGVPLHGSDTPVESIAVALRQRQIFLIFDNCDYFVAEAAELIDALLARVPGLSVLATSQEVLRVAAEKIYRLAPLQLPPIAAVGAKVNPDDVAEFGAIQLFVERAQATDRHFVLDARNVHAVADICRHLDGIPLALEMAAALLPLLGINGIRTELNERLNMLAIGTRAAESRHRTLRDLVEWSYGLLDLADQRLFRALGICPGTFSLETAVTLADGGGTSPWQVRHALGRLINKSLLTVETGEPPRYRLLETLRFYAAEQLKASGENEVIAERHAQCCAALFERADDTWETTPESDWLALYRPEIDNARAALDWAFAVPERAQIAVSLAGTAVRLWERLGLLAEGRRYADRAVVLIDQQTPTLDAARLLRQAGGLWQDSNHLKALTLLEQSAELYRQLGDRLNMASALAGVGGNYAFLGRHVEASAALYEAEAILLVSARRKSLLAVMTGLGIIAIHMKLPVEAHRCFARALELAGTLNDTDREDIIRLNLAELEFALGNINGAVERGDEAVSRLRSTEKRSYLGRALNNLASYLIASDEGADVRGLADEALSLLCEHSGYPVRTCLQLWALLGAFDGHYRDAAKIIGFVDAGYAAAGEIREATEGHVYIRLQKLLASALPPADIQAYAAEGARWLEHQAVAFVYDRLIFRR